MPERRGNVSPADSGGASGSEDDLQPNRRTQRGARHALFDRVRAHYAAGKTCGISPRQRVSAGPLSDNGSAPVALRTAPRCMRREHSVAPM
jgi:hypothetical protein